MPYSERGGSFLRGFDCFLRVAFREVLAMCHSIIELLEPELRDYGGSSRALRLIETPDWKNSDAENDWRRDIPNAVRENWGRLAIETRLIAYLLAARASYWS
jgi:hypothetical protein